MGKKGYINTPDRFQGRGVQMTWNTSTEFSKNRTKITWDLKGWHEAWAGWYTCHGAVVEIYADGNRVKTVSYDYCEKMWIGTRLHAKSSEICYISHNNSGLPPTITAKIKAKIYYSNRYTVSGSGTITTFPINRLATITAVSPSTITDETKSVSVSFSNPSNNTVLLGLYIRDRYGHFTMLAPYRTVSSSPATFTMTTTDWARMQKNCVDGYTRSDVYMYLKTSIYGETFYDSQAVKLLIKDTGPGCLFVDSKCSVVRKPGSLGSANILKNIDTIYKNSAYTVAIPGYTNLVINSGIERKKYAELSKFIVNERMGKGDTSKDPYNLSVTNFCLSPLVVKDFVSGTFSLHSLDSRNASKTSGIQYDNHYPLPIFGVGAYVEPFDIDDLDVVASIDSSGSLGTFTRPNVKCNITISCDWQSAFYYTTVKWSETEKEYIRYTSNPFYNTFLLKLKCVNSSKSDLPLYYTFSKGQNGGAITYTKTGLAPTVDPTITIKYRGSNYSNDTEVRKLTHGKLVITIEGLVLGQEGSNFTFLVLGSHTSADKGFNTGDLFTNLEKLPVTGMKEITHIKPVYQWNNDIFKTNVPLVLGTEEHWNKQEYDYKYGLDVNNQDIIGLNGLYFNDPYNATDEGLLFPRDWGGASHLYDHLTVKDGKTILKGNENVDTGDADFTHSFYYTPQDVIPISFKVCSGYVTSSASFLAFTITFDKPLVGFNSKDYRAILNIDSMFIRCVGGKLLPGETGDAYYPGGYLIRSVDPGARFTAATDAERSGGEYVTISKLWMHSGDVFVQMYHHDKNNQSVRTPFPLHSGDYSKDPPTDSAIKYNVLNNTPLACTIEKGHLYFEKI